MEVLYSVMQGLESRLGGGEGVEGIYGSITATGMHKVLESMRHNCGLNRNSTLIDIGAGLGRPLLHALLLHGIAHGYGVELDQVKVTKAEAFCKGVLDELTLRGVLSSRTDPSSHTGTASATGGRARAAGAPAAAAAAAAAEAGLASAMKPPCSRRGADGSTQAASSVDDDGSGGSEQGLLPLLDEPGSQASCGGSQEELCAAVGKTSAARADAAALAGTHDETADDTQAQVDCSQSARPVAAAAAAVPAAQHAKLQQHVVCEQQQECAQQLQQAAALGTGRKAGVQGRVKGAPLMWPASRPIITCAAVEQIASLDPGTHAYSFWEGVPLDGKRAFGLLFRTSKTLKAVAVVQRAMRGAAPEAVMAELGFGPLLLIKAFPVSMSGSGRSFTAYVFSKVAPPSAMLLMRCNPIANTDATASGQPAAQQQLPHEDVAADVLASSTKPRRGGRARQQNSSGPAAVRDTGADVDQSGSPKWSQGQQQQQEGMISLLTEDNIASMMQQLLSGSSPAKRAQPFLTAAAAASAAAAAAAEEADGSPSKKHKGLGSVSQPAGGAPAAGGGIVRSGSGMYGLRPRQLSYSNSIGSSRSSSRKTSATTFTTTTATAITSQRSPRSQARVAAGAGAADAGGAASRKPGLRSSSSRLSRAASMSVDQPISAVGSIGGCAGSNGGSSGGKGSRSTAVSRGSRSNKGKGGAKQQQPTAGGVGGAGTVAAAGSNLVHVVGSSHQGASGSSGAVSAAVSDARAAVAALDV